MINDPNYNLPKDAFIRLFDNPIPAGDPARSETPEWAQELDEVVVWAHMGENGQVSVKVNGEDIGGGGGETPASNYVLYRFSQTGNVNSNSITFNTPFARVDGETISDQDVEDHVLVVGCYVTETVTPNSSFTLNVGFVNDQAVRLTTSGNIDHASDTINIQAGSISFGASGARMAPNSFVLELYVDTAFLEVSE